MNHNNGLKLPVSKDHKQADITSRHSAPKQSPRKRKTIQITIKFHNKKQMPVKRLTLKNIEDWKRSGYNLAALRTYSNVLKTGKCETRDYVL